MSDAQLQRFPAFQSLPVYDESDERADDITSAVATGRYRALRECLNLREVEECLRDPQLVPLGALRVGSDGKPVVAYFGVRN